jgi:hypothetical protein
MPRTIRRTVVDTTPRWLRPRLSRSQVLDLQLLHIEYLDHIHSGQATVHTLWEWAALVFTWSRVAELLGLGVEEMAPQLHVVTALVERYGATGRVEFRGPEYDAARIGTIVMDTLAERTDAETARTATHWSEACLAELRAQHKSRAA